MELNDFNVYQLVITEDDQYSTFSGPIILIKHLEDCCLVWGGQTTTTTLENDKLCFSKQFLSTTYYFYEHLIMNVPTEILLQCNVTNPFIQIKLKENEKSMIGEEFVRALNFPSLSNEYNELNKLYQQKKLALEKLKEYRDELLKLLHDEI